MTKSVFSGGKQSGPLQSAAARTSGTTFTGHSSGPSRHFTAAICFNRRPPDSILVASCVSFFRYRSQPHVTRDPTSHNATPNPRAALHICARVRYTLSQQ